MKKVCLYMMMVFGFVISLAASKEVQAATKYYSSSQAQLPATKEGYQKLIKIRKMQGNTVEYQEAKLVFVEDAVEYKFSKVKTAKLSGNTQYYVGNAKKFHCNLGGTWYSNGSKWIGRESKGSFQNKYSNYIDSAIIVKNGKVNKIFSRISMAE